jgi:hypothetical protein
MFCWHNWTKWEQYTEEGVITGGLLVKKEDKGMSYRELRQRRRCTKCGKVQDEKVW